VNGEDVLKEIHAKYPGKPVVLMTGYRREMGNSIELGRQVGAYTCLYKPFESDDLFRVLEEIRIEKLQNVLVAA
jgi:DNA-binding NtrC family response regulator